MILQLNSTARAPMKHVEVLSSVCRSHLAGHNQNFSQVAARAHML